MIVRRVEPFSLARVMGAIYAFIGLIIALPMGCVAMVAGPMADEFGGFLGGIGLLFVIIYPIMLGVMGLVGGLITAVIYNFIAGRFGGVEIQVDTVVSADSEFA